MLLGWANRLGGIILYTVIYITIFSVLLFYANQVKIIKPETIKGSVTYSFIQPWGRKAIDGFASVIPFFKDMFTQLEGFFSRIPEKISV
jgi:membrane protein required for colicin V production